MPKFRPYKVMNRGWTNPWNTKELSRNTRLWRKKRVNSCPDSGRTKLGEKGWGMMPTQAKAKRKCHELAPERLPKVTQSAPKWFEIDAKTCQDPKKDAQLQKYHFFTDFGPIRDTCLGLFSFQKSYKMLPKSLPEIYVGKVSVNYNKI